MNVGRRLALAVALLAVATAVQPAVAHASTSRSAQPRAVSACTNDDVVPWLNTFLDGSAGSFSYSLVFTNVSATTCFLGGFAGVFAVTRGGSQIGYAAGRAGSASVNRQVRPGKSVYAMLTEKDPSLYGPQCESRTAYGLRVYVPNQFISETIPFPFTMCARTTVHVLSIGAISGGGVGPVPAGATTVSATSAHTLGSRSVRPCTNDQIVPWLDTTAQGVSPGVVFTLHFTNVSTTTCYLKGYPGVSAVTRAGSQIGGAATRDGGVPVVARQVAPGASVTADLEVRPQGQYTLSQCGDTYAFVVRVYVPNQIGWEDIPYPMPVCATASRDLLSVYPVT